MPVNGFRHRAEACQTVQSCQGFVLVRRHPFAKASETLARLKRTSI